MRDNPEGGELNPAEGVRTVRRRCKKNSPFVLSCIGKNHSGRDGKGPPREPKGFGRRGSCEKDFGSKKSSGCAYLCNDRGQRAESMDNGKCCSGFGVCHLFFDKSSMTGNPLEA